MPEHLGQNLHHDVLYDFVIPRIWGWFGLTLLFGYAENGP